MADVGYHQGKQHPYHRPVELPFTLPTRVYGGMLVVWQLRPALQRRFPLHRGRKLDYLRFLAWCTSIGRRQYKLLCEIDAWNRELMQPISMPSLRQCRWGQSYTVGMYLAGITRAKYWQGQLLYSRTMRHRAARWYFRDGRRLIALPECPAWQRQSLEKNFNSAEHFVQSLLLPKDREQGSTQQIRSGVADITDAWQPDGSAVVPIPPPAVLPLKTKWHHRLVANWLPAEANELVWLRNELRQKLNAKAPAIDDISRLLSIVSLEKPNDLSSLTQVGQRDGRQGDNRQWGVNLVGYARGELGIGEDVRMLARSMDAAGIPFCVINVEPGADVSQADTTVEHWISNEPCYGINIFCMTGIEMSRLTLEKGLSWLQGYYNIGLWPWELPEWPQAWHHAWSLLDELWGISRYTADAYGAAPVPVHAMPLPVAVDKIAKLDRSDWGLPQHDYLFVFSFDMNSTLARKNPMATVQAFLQAFSARPEARVGLVIKISHLKKTGTAWKTLQTMMKKDSRIYLFSGELRKDEVLALYRACNCFVSLHRAEGFGRGLAEAQLLGLDLITTGFSGNMDFCADGKTHVVDYSLISVGEGEYFFGAGQVWAEPDVSQAAKLMSQCSASSAPQPLYNHARFSPEYCGQAYLARLGSVYKERCSSI